MREPWLLGVLGLCALCGAVTAVKAVKTYRYEAGQFHPPRENVERPSDADALGIVDVALQVRADLVVRGWYLPSKNGSAVVFVHGSPSNRLGLLPEARALSHAGFGALLIDMPGHGESDGQATWGETSRAAIGLAVDNLQKRPEIRKIGAFGFSMGSSVVASVAAVDPRISSVVLEGVFTTSDAQLRHEFSTWGPITALPALWAARRNGLAIDELRTVEVVAKISPRPLLVISGTADWPVPLEMERTVFDAAKDPKEFLAVPGAPHGGYAAAMGDAYFARVVAFFTRTLQASN
jgi:pimeloyl-ACP methyl ester carboxylesterase